jgi:hypothetical protein
MVCLSDSFCSGPDYGGRGQVSGGIAGVASDPFDVMAGNASRLYIATQVRCALLYAVSCPCMLHQSAIARRIYTQYRRGLRPQTHRVQASRRCTVRASC